MRNQFSNPMSDPRDSGIYIRYQTRRGLVLAAMTKADDTNADSLADEVLSAWLAKEHANIVKHIQEQSDARKDFESTLKPKAKF